MSDDRDDNAHDDMDRIVGVVRAALDSPGGNRRESETVATTIGRLVASGELRAGDRLPTVRTLAKALCISPTTVSEAWRSLSSAGVITTNGRNGTRVRANAGSGAPTRYRALGTGADEFRIDLSSGIPDPTVLPDLGPSMARVGRADLTSSYLDDPVVPALGEHLVATWPFPPESLTVVDGCLDALDRISTEILPFGSAVLVEEPTFPPLIDLLERLGCEVIGVGVDAEGPIPADLVRGLEAQPVAFFTQPRAHNPTGVSISESRARVVADLLRPTEVLLVEDDHAWGITTGPVESLGDLLPGRVVHIRGFSKSHGPDLRLAAIGGPSEVIGRVRARRMLGAGWSSRLLQLLLLDMLSDDAVIDAIAEARVVYTSRRRQFLERLRAHGIDLGEGDGLNLWVPVDDEQSALVALAAAGVRVAPGAPFTLGGRADHVRLTVGLLPETEADWLAGLMASAARAGGTPRVSRDLGPMSM
jgi:DNA-binding transcriptional MocR family regulator